MTPVVPMCWWAIAFLLNRCSVQLGSAQRSRVIEKTFTYTLCCVYVVCICCMLSCLLIRVAILSRLSFSVSQCFGLLSTHSPLELHRSVWLTHRVLSFTLVHVQSASQPASHYTLTYIGSKKKKKTDTVNDNTSTITLGEKNVHRMLSDWIHSSFSRVSFVKRSGYTQSLRCAFSGSGRMMFREWKSSATTANILYEDWYFLCVRTDFGNFFGNRKFTWDHIKLVSC